MKTAVVTGATGFIGSRLMPALARRNVSVCAVTRRNVGGLPGAARVAVAGDACVSTLVAEADPEVVFHLAGVTDEAAARQNPALAFEANARLVWDMLEAIRHSGRRPIVVLASTVAVYGDNGGRPSTETDPLRGNSPYQLSKIAGESAARAFADLGMRVRIARIGNVFGPGDRSTTRLIPDTLASIRENRPPVLRAPDALRSHLHIDDCVSGLISLAGVRGAALDGHAVNICAERGITNIDLVRLMLARAGREDLRPDLAPDPGSQQGLNQQRHSEGRLAGHRGHDPASAGKPVSVRLASAALARQSLGWAPEITLEQGFGDLLETRAA